MSHQPSTGIESRSPRIATPRWPLESATERHLPAKEPDYYQLSFLKPPVWKWQIAWYFFFGGLSAGCYLIGSMARWFGGAGSADLSRQASRVAFAASLPCAPLLIHDLGDPKRFHHMLRLLKPASPMSLGTWVLTGFSSVLFVRVAFDQRATAANRRKRRFANRIYFVVDSAGVPLALLMASYTGVLLSCTANPVWCQSLWLSPLFTASALSNGSSALALLPNAADGQTSNALSKMSSAAHAAEAACLAAYINEKKELAEPLTRGTQRLCFWGAIAGIVASEICKRSGSSYRWKTLSSIFGLAAGLSLRWAVVYAGQESAKNSRHAKRLTGSKGA
jgi:formate-dependent nitrite reductase membrane component NrfD